MLKMNNKGFLLGEETLKTVLAVIAIGFLIFFVVSLYYSFSRNKELDLAEASLGYLVEQIELENEEVEIYNPEGWGFTSYGEEDLPDFCAGWENCVCLCKVGGFIKSAKEDCLTTKDKERTCVESEYTIFAGNILIEPPLILSIDYTNKIIMQEE